MYTMPRRSLCTITMLSCLGGCGLFDLGSDGDGDGGGLTGAGTGGWTEPPTTGIEPTGADNMLPDDEQCPCVADNEDIYLLSDYGEIWSFDPDTLDFTFITTVECGGMTDTFSMGVSRKGRAWIEYFSGDIYTLDLKDPDAACKDPGFVNDDPLFPNFGMAFVGNSATDRCDKLYVHSGISPDLSGDDIGALGVIDPQTLKITHVAPIDYAWGELAGTGDGRLFALEGYSPPVLSEYDKDTGTIKGSRALPGLGELDAFAFAFWGGQFYFFTTPDPPTGFSRVVSYDFYAQGAELTTIVEQAPIRIVGAGVSTCAPPCSHDRASCPGTPP